MKKYVLCILCVLLTGCAPSPKELDAGMQLRSSLLQASQCTFTAEISADYGDRISGFTLDVTAENSGDLLFTVTSPDSIAGITGKLTGEGGQFIFDDAALHFPLMADGILSPVSSPWILLKGLRSGFLSSACSENGEVRLSVDDTYAGDDLRLDIWLSGAQLPRQADILHEGRRILTVAVSNFVIS